MTTPTEPRPAADVQMTPPERREMRPGLMLLLALAAVTLAYSNAFSGPFVWDDHALIEEQEIVRELQPLGEYFRRDFWTDELGEQARNFFRPLTTLSYALNYAIGDGDPAGFHATNVLLHLVVCALVFLLGRRIGLSPAASALAAALFGTMPRLSESVAWISGRTDVLAGVAVGAALLLHDSGPRGAWRRWAAAAGMLLGLLCKEVAIAAVAGVAVLEWYGDGRGKPTWSRRVRNLVPMAVACVAYALLRAQLPEADGSDRDHALPGSLRLIVPFEVLGTYATMLVDALRPRTQIGLLGIVDWPRVVLGGALAAATLGWALRPGRRDRWVMSLVAVAAVALGLVLHVIPLSVKVVAADRFLYVPAMGLALLAVRAATRLPAHWQRPAAVAGLVFVVTFGAATWVRNHDWMDESRFWADALRTRPEHSVFTIDTAGGWLFEHEHLDEALETFRYSMEVSAATERLGGRYAELFAAPRATTLNVAVLQGRLGRHADADALFEQLERREPQWLKPKFNRSTALLRALRFDDARRQLARITDPDTAELRAQLRTAIDEAEAEYASLPPGNEDEPPATTAQRARFFDQIGAQRRAAEEWTRVLTADNPSLLKRAAGYLVVRGRQQEAEKALDVLRRGGLVDEEFEAFEAHVAARRAVLTELLSADAELARRVERLGTANASK